MARENKHIEIRMARKLEDQLSEREIKILKKRVHRDDWMYTDKQKAFKEERDK